MSCFSCNDPCSCSRVIPALIPISRPDPCFCPDPCRRPDPCFCPDPCHRPDPCFCPDPCHRPDPCRCVQCIPCPPFPPVCDPRIPSYAYFFTVATQPLVAGQSVAFGTGTSTPDIVLSGGNLLFTTPGVYLIDFGFSLVPPVTAGIAVNLTLNGVPVPGASIVTTTDTGYSGRAIVTVPAGGVLALTVAGAVTVASASITAVRIAC